MTRTKSMHHFQEHGHGADHDYSHGSPHLKHRTLNRRIVETVLGVVGAAACNGRVRVLEVGAGHGPLTEHMTRAGAAVVVTEMSEPSVEVLKTRFADEPSVSVVFDPTGVLPVDGRVDVVVYVSVLHHIPDYVSAVTTAAQRIRPGGSLVSFQDPLWYDRVARPTRFAAAVFFALWRLRQGQFWRGIKTVTRRLRGVYDEAIPSDMTEYHVVREGVDEEALVAALDSLFESVVLHPYWSAQAGWAQWLGARLCAPNTFGLVATGRRSDALTSAADH